ncbi:transcriptional regulator, TetR family [Nitratiruptor sp. YY08-26]|uniref:TetR/AcrR family transcriptional regulator n=1 Tax=unclassified Nitratiruptor TaxID=2624044 RepID=UPI0019167542|nr:MULTISPECIES: TetR/AcrR family transcriptional regulator [unclassified Nitratiruptor]BCD62241.1 transcriptional regulator, TetR family [Nitratiruptor sp. YY08-13]BCD66177.1 transcriptional regulator, TetR family [Nitratiruptor sp. YY08-26]
MDAQIETTKKGSTKEKILDAALELIAQMGYQKASMRKIAKKVGLRESAIYNHYKNKEEIFFSILQKIFVTDFDNFFLKKPPQEHAHRGKRYLYEYVATIKLISFDSKHEKLFRIVLWELMENSEIRKMFLEHFFDKNIKNLAEAFFLMMQKGLIRSGDPMLTAQEFFAPLFYFRIQILLFKMENRSTTHLSTIFEKHVDFFWEGVCINSFEPT